MKNIQDDKNLMPSEKVARIESLRRKSKRNKSNDKYDYGAEISVESGGE